MTELLQVQLRESMSASSEPPILQAVPPAVRHAVLQLLLPGMANGNNLPLDRQIAEDAQRFGPGYWNTMVAVFHGPSKGLSPAVEDLHAACWLQLHVGKVATIHGPRFVTGPFDEPLADRLLAMAVEAAKQQQVDVAQAIIDLVPAPEQAAWYRAGCHRVAELLYMSCEITDELPSLRGLLRFEPCKYDDANPTGAINRQLAALVDATYAYSLDCPRLDGLRQAEDVLIGYRATGGLQSSRWLLAYEAHELQSVDPIGCLFVADHPHGNQCELLYMGIVPSHRGRGLGQALVSKALQMTAELGRSRLVLAVDADNWPAFRHYAGVGFRTFAREQVFMLAFDSRQLSRPR